MSLASLQQRFLAQVVEDEDGNAMFPGWDERFARGLDIYRNAYRTRLVTAIEETFPRTLRWVGEEAFGAAAAHHLISYPPRGWTLDQAGAGFPATLAELFAGDPEVGELAWLELAMHEAFVAADAVPLDPAGFARSTAGFGDEDWEAMRIALVPSFRLSSVGHDCVSLWRQLGEDTPLPSLERLESQGWCGVWREGLRPLCRMMPRLEGQALMMLVEGAGYGELCAVLVDALGEQAATLEAGALLARWLALGIVGAVTLPRTACNSPQTR